MGNVTGSSNRCGFKLHSKSCCRPFSQEKKCICHPLRFPEPHVKCTTSSQFLLNLTILELHFLLQNKAYDIRFNIDGLWCIATPPARKGSLYHDSHFVLDDFFEIYRDRRSPLAMNKPRLLWLANAHYIICLLLSYCYQLTYWISLAGKSLFIFCHHIALHHFNIMMQIIGNPDCLPTGRIKFF